MMKYLCFILCVAGFWFVKNADAHGRLMKPCQRASLFRCYDDRNFPPNYDDMSLFCGGAQTQWNVNGGKCGICGDAYNGARRHEAGGKYATGFITETYRQGQEIDATVKLTAAHGGKFFFKICKQTNVNIEVTQECLDKSQLKVVQNGELKDYYTVTEVGFPSIDMKLKLPDDLTCEHCVFQWWYTTGNSWRSTTPETFVNCADVKIIPRDGAPEPVTKVPTAKPITNRPQTVRPITNRPQTMRPITRRPSTANPWMTPSPSTKRTTTTPRSITRAPPNPGGIVTSCSVGRLSCRSAGVFANNRGYDIWCYQYCKANSPNCNPQYCSCTCKSQCTIKATFQFMGTHFCNYLSQSAPHYINHFCNCI
ncbi:uncharacterized protein LOC125663750 [Ostrea edulis]|uniref:uncharacterized protein LOC125663750 n=1 Tax=Ostrea edulis TaxID=37623 RepID=UPI0024AEEFCB|nr:uncharacterized protein LOC125663750 [Ostrea edulis]